MPEACRVGSRAQQAAQVLLLAWQIDAALVLLLFSTYLNDCFLPRCVEAQIQTPVSIADVIENEPHFGLEAVPKMKTEKFSREKHQFRVHKIDD